MDIEKCFDKMSYRETANDIWLAGVQDDKFLLMAKSNEKCQVAVKTPWGSVTDTVEMKEIVTAQLQLLSSALYSWTP